MLNVLTGIISVANSYYIYKIVKYMYKVHFTLNIKFVIQTKLTKNPCTNIKVFIVFMFINYSKTFQSLFKVVFNVNVMFQLICIFDMNGMWNSLCFTQLAGAPKTNLDHWRNVNEIVCCVSWSCRFVCIALRKRKD